MTVLADAASSTSDWIIAYTGIGALAAAFVTVFATVRQLRILVRGNLRDQAAKFGMWAEPSTVSTNMDVYYANSSGVPVYNVHATVTVGGTKWTTYLGNRSPATKESVADISAELHRRIDAELTANPGQDVDSLRNGIRVATTFRDASGVTWTRDANGRLRKVRSRRCKRT